MRRRRGLDATVPFCPKCGGTLVQAWLPGPSMHVLVDTARPEAGVLAVQVQSDDFPDGVFRDPWPVLCAVCEQDCGKRPRQWGHPLYAAMMTVLEEGPWPPARDWEVEDLRTDWYQTRLRNLVDEHEEQLTGQAPFRYGPSRLHPDPPGRGAPEEADAGQRVDHPAPGEPPAGGDGEAVNALTASPPGVDEAAGAVLAALGAVEKAREVLGAALRAEQGRTGASANELAGRVRGAMSRPLVLKALRETL